MAYSDVKDINKFPEIKKWSENKYRAEMNKTSWKRFSNYLISSDAHMLLRIVNLNIQITLNSHTLDEIEVEADSKVDMKLSSSFVSFQTDIKQETIQHEALRLEPDCNSNLKDLTDCIEQVKAYDSPLVSVNGAFSFYLDDTSHDFITSSTMSPNGELVSFTTEASSIYIYRPHDVVRPSGDKKCYKELIGGHAGGPIFKSKFTHDSKYLISCGDDGQACLWRTDFSNDQAYQWDNQDSDSENDEQWFRTSQSPVVCYYSAHLYPVWDVEPFSKLNLFATGSRDNTSRLWSFDRIYPLRVFSGHHSDVNCVKFHPNGTYLATGSSDKTVRSVILSISDTAQLNILILRLWSVQGGEFVRLFSSHRSRVFCVAFSPDGNYLASSGEDKRIKLWDLRWGHLYKEFKGHSDMVHALEFDSTSQILCSAGRDKSVKLWRLHQNSTTTKLDLSSSSDFASSFKSVKNNSGAQNNTGGELISSVGVNFNVFSIQRDEQNVFYFTGARKPLTHTIGNSNRNKVNGSVMACKLEGSRSVLNINQSNKSQKNSKQTPTASTTLTESQLDESKPNTRRRTVTTGSIANQSNHSSSFLLDNDDLYEV